LDEGIAWDGGKSSIAITLGGTTSKTLGGFHPFLVDSYATRSRCSGETNEIFA
jgi:hypothetical protein